MKRKHALLFLFSVFISVSFAQSKNKNVCKLVQDKESNMEYFINPEQKSEVPIGFNLEEFVMANFRLPDKHYGKKASISFSFIIDKSGKPVFMKMLALKDDKQIEEEVKRIVALMPAWKVAMCGKEKVPSYGSVTFSVSNLLH